MKYCTRVLLIDSNRTYKHTNKFMFSYKKDKRQTGNTYHTYCTDLIIVSGTINHSVHTIHDIVQYNLYVVYPFRYNYEGYCTSFGI